MTTEENRGVRPVGILPPEFVRRILIGPGRALDEDERSTVRRPPNAGELEPTPRSNVSLAAGIEVTDDDSIGAARRATRGGKIGHPGAVGREPRPTIGIVANGAPAIGRGDDVVADDSPGVEGNSGIREERLHRRVEAAGCPPVRGTWVLDVRSPVAR